MHVLLSLILLLSQGQEPTYIFGTSVVVLTKEELKKEIRSRAEIWPK